MSKSKSLFVFPVLSLVALASAAQADTLYPAPVEEAKVDMASVAQSLTLASSGDTTQRLILVDAPSSGVDAKYSLYFAFSHGSAEWSTQAVFFLGKVDRLITSTKALGAATFSFPVALRVDGKVVSKTFTVNAKDVFAKDEGAKGKDFEVVYLEKATIQKTEK